VLRLDISHVDSRAKTDLFWPRAEVTTRVKVEVEAFHGVSGRSQERDKNGSDVASITCYQDLHGYSSAQLRPDAHDAAL
jgi:hypothetical protein